MGSARRRKNKDYYAVVEGRVDEPTIFSSWGDAHPRVTGCSAVYKSFFTFEEAEDFMRKKGFLNCKKVIKDTALETTPQRNGTAYYAVAFGANPGIRKVWYGKTGALEEVDEISGACFKRFKTEAQAKAFIEDWKESLAEVWRRAIKEGLDQGLRPRGMELRIEGLLDKKDGESIEDITRQFGTKLELNSAEN